MIECVGCGSANGRVSVMYGVTNGGFGRFCPRSGGVWIAAEVRGCAAGCWGGQFVRYCGDGGVDEGQRVEEGLQGIVVEDCHGRGGDLLDFWKHPVEHSGGRG